MFCRGEKTRTSDLHVPNVARCQLCYTPDSSFLRKCGAKVVIIFEKISVAEVFFKNFYSRWPVW